MNSTPSRTWAVREDGEILFQICGPEAEIIARAAASEGGVLVYREDVRPTAENGWQAFGPWTEVE